MLIRNAILVVRWGMVIGALVLFMTMVLSLLSVQVLSRTLTPDTVQQKVIEHSTSQSLSYMQTYDWKSFDKGPKPIDQIYFYDTNFYMLGKQYEVLGDPTASGESNITDQETEDQAREEQVGENDL